jgi:2-polyprenyl-3-methyl-5-hydroxy-6-metoxy-1,4-benzoquinol methylase
VAEELAQRTVGGLHEALLPHVSGLPKEAQILDLGCGTGAWLARLADAGFISLTGVDQAPPPASAFKWPPPRLMQADLDRPSTLDPLHGTWDLVTAIEVIEHVANQGQFWDLIAALLKPGAFALITTPNLHSLPARLRWLMSGTLRQFDDHGDPTHITPVFLPLLPKLLEPRGLEVEATWSHPARGYLAMRPLLSALFRLLSFADTRPGDTLCLRIRKRSAV